MKINFKKTGIIGLLDKFYICPKCKNLISSDKVDYPLIYCSKCKQVGINPRKTYDLKKEYQNEEAIKQIYEKFKEVIENEKNIIIRSSEYKLIVDVMKKEKYKKK